MNMSPLAAIPAIMSEISRLVLLPKTPANVEAFEKAVGQAKAIIAEDSRTLGYFVQNDPINYALMITMALWTIQG
jgi:hypothetical protein